MNVTYSVSDAGGMQNIYNATLRRIQGFNHSYRTKEVP